VHLFLNEIEQIQDDKIRDFVVEALDKLPEFYEDLTNFTEETKKAVEYSKTLLEVLDADDYASDVVKSAILLQDITRYSLEEIDEGFGKTPTQILNEDPLHPLSARQKLLPLLGIVGAEKFDDILRTIESSHGVNSPIPQVMPTVNDPVYVWVLPFVNSLARA
jgi:hypothetical protein